MNWLEERFRKWCENLGSVGRVAAHVRARPWEAEKLLRAAARVGVSEVLASVSRLAATLVGRVAALSASLCF